MIALLSDAHEDQDDDQNQSQASARAVAPIPAVPPGREGADEEQDQDDQQDHTETHGSPLSMVGNVVCPKQGRSATCVLELLADVVRDILGLLGNVVGRLGLTARLRRLRGGGFRARARQIWLLSGTIRTIARRCLLY